MTGLEQCTNKKMCFSGDAGKYRLINNRMKLIYYEVVCEGELTGDRYIFVCVSF